MIQMIHCSGTGLRVRCQVVEPSLEKRQGWERSVQPLSGCPSPSLPTTAALSKLPLSFPWPRAERSWRQPALSLSSALQSSESHQDR